MAKVIVTQYKWAGRFWPFRIKTRCNECDTTTAILESMLNKEFKGKGRNVRLEVKPWLNNWYKIILKGGWHAPVVLVNNKIFSQGGIINREKLKDAVLRELKG